MLYPLIKFFLLVTVIVAGSIGCQTRTIGPEQRFNIEKRWVRYTPQKEHHGSYRQHRFEPIVLDQMIIQANAIDGLVAYNRQSASPVWRLTIKDGVEGGAVVNNDRLFFGASDGFFYSVKWKSGEVAWAYPIRSEALGTPLVANGVVYFLAGNNVFHALDANTGKLLWVYTRRDASNLSIRSASQPSISGDLVLVGFSDGSLVALKKLTGILAWETLLNRNKRFRDVDSRPVIDGERIYISSYDGALYCLKLTDGQVVWSVEFGGLDAPVISGKDLFYSTSDGRTLAIDKNSGKILWTYVNPNGLAVQPSIYRDLLLIGEVNGDLRFLDQRTGRLVGLFSPGWGVTAKPFVDQDKNEVYIMSAGANLFSLRLAWRRQAAVWPWE
jgi:outer membrane protein assembly factor BamB